MVIPARQTALEPGEAIGVRVLLESISKDSERADKWCWKLQGTF